MTLKHLRIFVVVCRCGSITEAGKLLYTAQPSVSLAIRELEEHYGTKLFDRISRRLHITESGKRLLEYATHIVSLFDEAENNIADTAAKGILRIGSSITIGNFLLCGYIEQLTSKYRDMKVKTYIDNSESIENMILKNELDIALIEGRIHDRNIIEEPFMDDELVFICGNGHKFAGQKIDAHDLQNEAVILREEGSAGREFFDSIMILSGVTVEPLWQSVSTQAIINAVKYNMGLSVLPYLFVKEEIETGNLKQFYIKNVSLKRKFSIIYHKNKHISAPISEFLQICKKQRQNSIAEVRRNEGYYG